MDNQLMLTYRTVSQVQQAISNARTLDEALREGLRTITKSLGAENSVIWYAEGDDPVLSPFFGLRTPTLPRSAIPRERGRSAGPSNRSVPNACLPTVRAWTQVPNPTSRALRYVP